MSAFNLAGGPPDLKQAIERFLRQRLSFVWRLWNVATASLPTASTDNEGGIVYDTTTSRLAYSDGSAWLGLMPYTAGAALTRTNDTNVTVTLGGSPATALLAATSLTLGWTGTLSVARGGSGAGTLTGLLVGNGTSAFTTIAPGTGVTTALAVNVGSAGAFVTFNGALGTPSSGTLTNCTFPTLNQNTTGSAATLTTGRTIGMTGDVTWTSASFNGSANVTGTATIANDAVTFAKMQNIATAKVIGRATAGTGDPEELSTTGTGNVVMSASPTLTGTAIADNITLSVMTVTGASGAIVLNDRDGSGQFILYHDTGIVRYFDGADRFTISGSTIFASGNLGVNTSSQFGSGTNVIGIANASANPSTNPSGGGVLYADAGALKWRGSSGTVTTIAAA